LQLSAAHLTLKTNICFPDEDSESKEVKPAEGEEKKEGAETTEENAEKPKKEWIINAWVKKQVAEKLPIIKPIPGFCEYFVFIFTQWKNSGYVNNIFYSRYHAPIGYPSSKIVTW